VIRKLIIGNGRSEREILLVGNIIIGRDPACHVSEPDPLLSRRHAELIANVHGVSIRDLNSRNGILVNGAKTREQVLLPGDVVQLGHLQLRYIEENVRVADGMASRGMPQRRQGPPPAAAPYDMDRYRPEPTPMPSRWRPEPTPLPGRRPGAPQPRVQAGPTPVPRGRAAFDSPMAPGGRDADAFDQTMAAPRQMHQDTTLGHAPADLDATILAPLPVREPLGGSRRSPLDSTMIGQAGHLGPDTTMAPGDSTFASALAHLSGLAGPGQGYAPQADLAPGATLVANADLTVTDASPECADVLGIPDDQLIGDSLADVFLRAVRRAYSDTNTAVSLTITRGARGSITVALTLDQIGETDR